MLHWLLFVCVGLSVVVLVVVLCSCRFGLVGRELRTHCQRHTNCMHTQPHTNYTQLRTDLTRLVDLPRDARVDPVKDARHADEERRLEGADVVD